MRRPRSGSHLVKRGEIYHYRRAIPADVRKAFGGKWELTKSLDTASETHAKRLEKALDVEFEERLVAARKAHNPHAVAERIASEIRIEPGSINHYRKASRALGEAPLTDEGRATAAEYLSQRIEQRETEQGDIARLLAEIGNAINPLSREQIARCRLGMLSIIRSQSAAPGESDAGESGSFDEPRTLEWAYSRWLRTRAGRRAEESVDRARSHFNEFLTHSKLVMLDQVRRSHVLAWRDSLSDIARGQAGKKLATNSVNQRIQLVGAILRTGWRDAEMAEQNLTGIVLPTDDEGERVAWTRREILDALNRLEPNSWSAWLYLIGLTTAVRLGEPTAARVGWFNPRTNMIEVADRRYTKGRKKLHVMPVIECLREPLTRLTEGRSPDDYLFADAPRPSNARIPISHETSKWFGRFFDRISVDRVFHELRHTWIEEARHCPSVKREIWEIISGHSAATISDRYGGEKPDVLLAANDEICKFLTRDAEIKPAMLRLVSYPRTSPPSIGITAPVT